MRPNLTLQSLREQLGKEVLLQTGTNEKENRQASSICGQSQEMQRKLIKTALSLLDESP